MEEPTATVSIVLSDMDRSDLASYGFRSWMLQDMEEPYEVVMNLFNDQQPLYESLVDGMNDMCRPMIRVYERPDFFNISAANNLGLHHATGTYVLFANSDIVYPGSYLRELIWDLRRHGLAYVTGCRINLNREQTLAFRPVSTYSRFENFDFLLGLEHSPGRVQVHGLSPWTVLRQVAYDIGGFDPGVLCYEDSEFNDRVLHYLRRTGQQDLIYANASLFGYHLFHETSELYGAGQDSAAILEPRRRRLQENPSSDGDVLPTQLESLTALEQNLHDTPPPIKNKAPRVKDGWARRTVAPLGRRLRAAGRSLLRGE